MLHEANGVCCRGLSTSIGCMSCITTDISDALASVVLSRPASPCCRGVLFPVILASSLIPPRVLHQPWPTLYMTIYEFGTRCLIRICKSGLHPADSTFIGYPVPEAPGPPGSGLNLDLSPGRD